MTLLGQVHFQRHNMEGKLGGLFDGERQIGGFLNWEFEVIFSDASEGKAKTYQFKKWILTAPSYWLFAEPDNVIVRLFFDIGTAYWEGRGVISSNMQKVFDTLIYEKIEIIGEGTLEMKK